VNKTSQKQSESTSHHITSIQPSALSPFLPPPPPSPIRHHDGAEYETSFFFPFLSIPFLSFPFLSFPSSPPLLSNQNHSSTNKQKVRSVENSRSKKKNEPIKKNRNLNHSSHTHKVAAQKRGGGRDWNERARGEGDIIAAAA